MAPDKLTNMSDPQGAGDHAGTTTVGFLVAADSRRCTGRTGWHAFPYACFFKPTFGRLRPMATTR